MTPPSRRAGWVAFLGAVATLTALFFSSCEKRSFDIPRGYRGEAARNPYLAAQRMLERMGTPVRGLEDLSGLTDLPPADGTLIIPTPRRTLTPARAQELMRWVESGGHLIVVTWQLFDDVNRSPDPVLDPLGVRQYQNATEEDEPRDDESEPDEPPPLVTRLSAEDEEDDETTVEVAGAVFPDRKVPLDVEFDPGFRIELDRAAADVRLFEISDANGMHLASLREGTGVVTAMTDDYFLTQPVIGDWDHAELVYRLAHFNGRNGPVWIVWGDQYPKALSLVWRYGWMVVTSALIVLGLWLWSASRRFGPFEPEPSTERRELMEHVRAAGRFQWRRGAAAALLAATRGALLERMRERHPGFAALVPVEQAERLAELSGLPSERVQSALAFSPDADSSQFIRNVRTLEKIRRSP